MTDIIRRPPDWNPLVDGDLVANGSVPLVRDLRLMVSAIAHLAGFGWVTPCLCPGDSGLPGESLNTADVVSHQIRIYPFASDLEVAALMLLNQQQASPVSDLEVQFASDVVGSGTLLLERTYSPATDVGAATNVPQLAWFEGFIQDVGDLTSGTGVLSDITMTITKGPVILYALSIRQVPARHLEQA